MPQQLTLNVLGDQDQGIIEEFRFFAGEERVLKLQVVEYSSTQKWSLPTATSITLTLSGTPDDVEIINANITIDSTDRSVFSTTISEVNTAKIITGMIQAKFEYSDGLQTVTRYALKEHAMKRITEE